MGKLYDEHYIRSVVTLGDTHKVFTNQAIFTSKKIKLIDKGSKVDSALFDRLVSHKLIPKIDECLSVENGITSEGLRKYAQELLDNDPGMLVLREQTTIRELMLDAFSDITLLPPLSFKLTVAQQQRPEIFNHSIRVALIALYLGINSALSKEEMTLLATASVFHDLGMLHISPDLLRLGRRLKESERHHLYVHPITGFMMLNEYPEYHPQISRTVFEHHERLDGSGYPRGLKEDEICLGAQILMVAEVVSTVFESTQSSESLAKFSVLLRLNQKKLNRQLCHNLLSILTSMSSNCPSMTDHTNSINPNSSLEQRLVAIASVFQDWTGCFIPDADQIDKESPSSLRSIIEIRLNDLRKSLHYTGLEPENTEALITIGREEPTVLCELNILLSETRWQLAEIIHEIERRISETDAAEEVPPSIRSWLERSKSSIEQF